VLVIPIEVEEPAFRNSVMLSSGTYDRITLQLAPPIAHLSLINPPVNVIDLRMTDELTSAFCEIESLSAISTVILSGEGKCFSAGVDVAAHTPDKIAPMLQKFHGVVRAILNTKKIALAVVHGDCLGGAAELAMVCDFAITTASATWGFPEIKLGCFPPVAATALSALVGQKRAADLILTGRSISGTEAAAIGLATVAVPDDQLSSAVQEKLSALSGLSASALAVAKKAIYAWDSMHFDKGLARAEKIYLEELMQTDDAQEGIRAFLEKRSPRWTNR
jgi:cyclohexa-1,5-dienecarbonyl-CoA hydratase